MPLSTAEWTMELRSASDGLRLSSLRLPFREQERQPCCGQRSWNQLPANTKLVFQNRMQSLHSWSSCCSGIIGERRGNPSGKCSTKWGQHPQTAVGISKQVHKFWKTGKGAVKRRLFEIEATRTRDQAEASKSGTVDETAFLHVSGVSYHPPGADAPLLNNVSLSMPSTGLGLIYGKSGSGKTTLLQVLAGMATPTSGSVFLRESSADGELRSCTRADLSARAGIVFQFPERYFLADSVLEELTFGWPRRAHAEDFAVRQQLGLRLQMAVMAVGMGNIALDASPRALSDGYKRRLALAIQLVRLPNILLLDEPLAGLDWRARMDVVRLLTTLKKERTLIVVSHDLRELSPLVDRAWCMEPGGNLAPSPWPLPTA